MKNEFNHKTGAYFEIDYAKIYYEEIQNIGKPVLLFLHGGMGDITDYNPIIPFFEEDYHIIGIDSRGHGKSTLGTEKLTYKRLQLDVELIINYLKLENINIIGFSDGGVVAYRLALSKKISIKKIVTLGAVCDEHSAENNEKFFANINYEDYIHIFKKNFDFYEKYNLQPNTKKLIKYVKQMWFDKSKDGYPHLNIQNINIPTLIVRGNDDFDPLEQYFNLAEKIPNSILFNVPFEGHVPVFEKYPHFFAEVTKDFFLTS
ncbi:MAG: alpha/beta hydrolase [Defluviitaleaceae bacterium]|nr:alpha/beta hydrolase [Defluviitaleaceae bacterium]